MNLILPEQLLNILAGSMVFSIVLMSLIQKIKTFEFVNKAWHIWITNLILSFLLGIPFGMSFYSLDFLSSIWIGVFSFIGASTLYETLKNYNPVTLSETFNSNKQ